MDKKKSGKRTDENDIRGFEEFIQGQSKETHFLPRPGAGTKKDISFEHFTFLTNDAERLVKLKDLLTEKLPFSAKFEQGNRLLDDQREEITQLKDKIFTISDCQDSPYRKSLGEIVDSFFAPPKT